MGYIPTPDQALDILKKYNKDAFHLHHAKTVGKVLGRLADHYDPERNEYWEVVGILHDIDFELYPEEHCQKAPELLRENDIDEDIIHAVVSHGYGICSDVAPELPMEKVLFAVDELTGLIGAVALVRPSGMEGLEVKSVMKKFKDKSFAAGCSREVITRGAALLDMEISALVSMTLQAMQD